MVNTGKLSLAVAMEGVAVSRPAGSSLQDSHMEVGLGERMATLLVLPSPKRCLAGRGVRGGASRKLALSVWRPPLTSSISRMQPL